MTTKCEFMYMKFAKSMSQVWLSSASWNPGSKNVPIPFSMSITRSAFANATASLPSVMPRTTW